MDRLTFECTLLTKVVLISVSATEGFHKSLDYIPGSKFLGLVARKLYKPQCDDDPNTAYEKSYEVARKLYKPQRDDLELLDLFHNGIVRYGDALPVIDSLIGYKVPFSWLTPKGGKYKDGVYVHSALSEKEKKQLIDNGIQLETAKDGCFTTAGKTAKINQSFSLKSAYNPELRRAKDSQMYGYSGLEKGTIWRFEVAFDKPEYIEEVREALIGQHRVGRSKSAEYGLVSIKEITTERRTPNQIPAGTAYMYAVSNWCFYDKYGRTTATPTESQLGLPEGSEVDWDKSTVRSRIYRTWNQKRSNRNEDRLIIQRGSVIAVKLKEPLNAGDFEKGIGACRNEGFGQVWFNPEYVKAEPEKLPFKFIESSQDKVLTQNGSLVMAKGADDELVLSFLQAKQKEAARLFNIDAEVNEFIETHQKQYAEITSSQWGQVRNIAKNVATGEKLKTLLFDKRVGFFFYGQMELIWRKNGRRSTLEKLLFGKKEEIPSDSGIDFKEEIPSDSVIDFVVKLATEMAKAAQNKVKA